MSTATETASSNHTDHGDKLASTTDTTTVTEAANPILQEALGVTATGTCLRHPNCPVMVASKIMSCRVCFTEEKSVGNIQQRNSFAAVIQQVQRNANAAAMRTMDEGSQVDPATTTNDSSVDNQNPVTTTAENVTTDVDVLQEPHALESLMKRLAQVQNWILRKLSELCAERFNRI
jgi:hypothetical protein